jgi:hypothetical protein
MVYERTWISREHTDDQTIVVMTNPRQDDDDVPPREYRFARVQAAEDEGIEVVQADKYVTDHVCEYLREVYRMAVIVPARIDPEEQTVLLNHAA